MKNEVQTENCYCDSRFQVEHQRSMRTICKFADNYFVTREKLHVIGKIILVGNAVI